MPHGRLLALLRPPPPLSFALGAGRLGRGLLLLWRHVQEARHDFAFLLGDASERIVIFWFHESIVSTHACRCR